MRPQKFKIGERVWSTRLRQVVTITGVRRFTEGDVYDFAELGSGSPPLEPEDYLEKLDKQSERSKRLLT